MIRGIDMVEIKTAPNGDISIGTPSQGGINYRFREDKILKEVLLSQVSI